MSFLTKHMAKRLLQSMVNMLIALAETDLKYTLQESDGKITDQAHKLGFVIDWLNEKKDIQWADNETNLKG